MKYILLFFCLFTLNRVTLAQTYYIRLEDASGINTDRYQDSLEMAAADLMNAFPSDAYRDSFRVYDFGFYLHQETYKGGYPEAMLQKIQEIEANGTPYYLLFGKQTDKTGIYTKIWVELKLPETRKFSCLKEEERKFLRINLHGIANSNLYQPDKMYLYYARSEKRTIDSLTSMVKKIVDCCYNADNSNCTQCLTPVGIQTYLLEQGFIAIPIKILGNATLRDSSNISKRPSGRVTDCAQKSIEIDGVVIPDLGEVIDNIMSCYGDPNVKAVITDGDCNNCNIEFTIKDYYNVELRIHLQKFDFDPLSFGIKDMLYIKWKNPNQIGQLPFRGHMPVFLSNANLERIDIDYINSTCVDIFVNNGMSLYSLDNQLPVNVDPLDLVNGLNAYIFFPTDGGNSQIDCETLNSNYWTPQNKETLTGYINLFNILENDFWKKLEKTHFSYIIGNILAHEFVHQIYDKCAVYISRDLCGSWGINLLRFTGGHINDRPNLMVSGDWYFTKKFRDKIFKGMTIEEIETMDEQFLKGNLSQYFTHILPKANLPIFDKWEVVPRSYKIVICMGLLLREVEEIFGKNSCEFHCSKKIFYEFIKQNESKFEKYDPFEEGD